MSKKETKEKLKQLPSKSMEELFREGKVGEFDHLKEISDYKIEEKQNATSK